MGGKLRAVLCVRLARAIYIRCMYGICGRKITTYTVIYSVYEWFWPTLLVCIECRRFKAALQKSWEFGCLDAAQTVCLLQLQELGVWLFRCSTESVPITTARVGSLAV